jgi:hypothetical protein
VDQEELDRLSSRELHDRAVDLARRRFDVGFLWTLVKAVPVAHAAQGQVDEADADITSLSALLTDVVGSGEGDVAEGLRPIYIDYLRAHGG